MRAKVEAEGLRPLSYSSGVPISVIRSALDDRNLTFTSVSLLTDMLGWDLRIGPGRDGGPEVGFADSIHAFEETQAVYALEEPVQSGMGRLDPLPGDGVFIVRPGFSVLGDLPSGTYCLVEPEAPLRNGDLVYIEDATGGVNLGRYHGANENGWPRIMSHGGEMLSEWNPDRLRRIAPITWTGWTPPPFVTSETAAPARPRDTSAIEARVNRMIRELEELREEITG